MFKPVARLVSVLTAAAFLAGTSAAVAQPIPAPQVAAKSWLLLDVTSGQTLGAQNADMRVDPASLTKLMTAYLVFAALKEKKLTLDQSVTPSTSILKVKSEESRMFIEPNKPVAISDLIQGMIVQSGNDACIALAEAVAGSEEVFVSMMNREAERMGMKGTHYMNTTGMPDPDHYTTANDLSILASHLIKDFPDLYAYYSQKEFTYNGIKQTNRNRLLWIDPTVDGMKTGYTKSAGYCLVSSAQRPLSNVPDGKRRLLSIMLGTANEQARAQESLKVLNYGFQFFDTLRMYNKNEVIATPDVYKGKAGSVKIGVLQETFVSVPKGTGGRLKPVLERVETIIAPVTQGQKLGSVKLMDGNNMVAEFPVVALEAVPEAGFFGRLWDTIRLWFKRS